MPILLRNHILCRFPHLYENELLITIRFLKIMRQKKIIILTGLYVLAFCLGCNKIDDSGTLDAEQLIFEGDLNSDMAKLDALLEEIISIAKSEVCLDSKDWLFTPIGYKSCGGPGPTAYLAYSKKLNVNSFLEKVEIYRVSQKKVNEKWKLVSTCELVPEPMNVICENGEAVFVY